MYEFWVFVHLVGVFGFLLSHGVSAAVALSLRREREPQRVRALLELSSFTMTGFYVSFLVLLAGGIIAGFLGHWWSQGWIWAALGVLVVMMGGMYGLAATYYGRLRAAVGMPARGGERPRALPPTDSAIPTSEAPPQPIGATPQVELEALFRSSRPLLIVGVGLGGLLLILWLMVYKPF